MQVFDLAMGLAAVNVSPDPTQGSHTKFPRSLSSELRKPVPALWVYFSEPVFSQLHTKCTLGFGLSEQDNSKSLIPNHLKITLFSFMWTAHLNRNSANEISFLVLFLRIWGPSADSFVRQPKKRPKSDKIFGKARSNNKNVFADTDWSKCHEVLSVNWLGICHSPANLCLDISPKQAATHQTCHPPGHLQTEWTCKPKLLEIPLRALSEHFGLKEYTLEWKNP